MANYDAGHYFLNVMVPLDRQLVVEVDGERQSAVDHVRAVLADLPVAQQDSTSVESDPMSPFASVPGTHFAHIFIIDDVRYNGRRPSNPILDLIFNVKLTVAEQIDRLPFAYVVLALDFDALDGSDASLRAYTDGLWRNMADTLHAILQYCAGWEDVRDEESFFELVKNCMVETVMPFNDYWAYAPPARNPVPCMIGTSAVLAILGAIAVWLGWWTGGIWVLAALILVLALLACIGIIAWFGLTPFPAAPDSDLDSVLKALYIQQMFTGFAINHLGCSDEDLARDFDEFCLKHMPGTSQGPSQPPGVLSSRVEQQT